MGGILDKKRKVWEVEENSARLFILNILPMLNKHQDIFMWCCKLNISEPATYSPQTHSAHMYIKYAIKHQGVDYGTHEIYWSIFRINANCERDNMGTIYNICTVKVL